MENNEAQETKGRGEKYSITAYLVLLFVVVIALVLLSYFVNSRGSDERIDEFSFEQNTRVSVLEGRLTELETTTGEQNTETEQLEQLIAGQQTEMGQLRESSDAQEARLDGLEERITRLEGRVAELEEVLKALELQEKEEKGE